MSNLDNCICTGKSLPKLLRPAILAVLTQGPKHGYAITEELSTTTLLTLQILVLRAQESRLSPF